MSDNLNSLWGSLHNKSMVIIKSTYLRREGAPGNYKYIYADPKGGEKEGKPTKAEHEERFKHAHSNVSAAGHEKSARGIQARIKSLEEKGKKNGESYSIAISDLKATLRRHLKAAEEKKNS